jgi:hypothetical protein
MTMEKRKMGGKWSWLVVGGVLAILTGCDKGSAGTSASSDGSGSAGSAPASTPASASQPRMKADKAAMEAAKLLVRDTCSQIGFMTDDTGFDKSVTGIDNAHGKVDVEAVTKALDLLATLPDHTDNDFIQPLSKVIPPIREAMTLYQQALAGKKPFSDGSGNGEKMAKLAGDNTLNIVVATDESLKLVDDQ